MATIAVFNSKGGVGKTTLALNLAAEAVRAGHKTLLWEIDAQGDSSWLVESEAPKGGVNAASLMQGSTKPLDLVRPSKIPGLSILAADTDMRRTENFLVHFARERRLVGLLDELESHFDVIIFDNPPGFCDANRKLLMVVNLVIVPVIPSPLAMRGLLRIRDFMTRNRGAHAPILPVFSMTDKRRSLHKAALEAHPEWPSIAMSSEVEKMATVKLPVAGFSPKSPTADAFRTLWRGVEQKLARMRVIRVPQGHGESCAENRSAPVGDAQSAAPPAAAYFQWKQGVLTLPLE